MRTRPQSPFLDFYFFFLIFFLYGFCCLNKKNRSSRVGLFRKEKRNFRSCLFLFLLVVAAHKTKEDELFLFFRPGVFVSCGGGSVL